MTTITPTLSATSTDPDGDPISYRFQVTTDSGFSSLDVDALVASSTYAVPPAALEDGLTYYWRVQAQDVDGASAWSSPKQFTVHLQLLGLRSYFPIWSHGPITVNLSNGNLILALPTPDYQSAAGSIGPAITYNTISTTDIGLGEGWMLAPARSGPAELIDHGADSTGAYQEVERIWADGASDFYSRIGVSNTYLPAIDDGSILTRAEDGSGWQLTEADGSVYEFGAETGGVSKVTGEQTAAMVSGGGKLSYAYTSGKLTGISVLNGATTLTHVAVGWNSLGTCSSAVLCVTGPDGVTWTYGGVSSATAPPVAIVKDGVRNLMALDYSTVFDGSATYVSQIQNANDLDATHASPGYDSSHRLTIGYAPITNRVARVTESPLTGQQSSASSIWTVAYDLPCCDYDGHQPAGGTARVQTPNQQSTGPVESVSSDDLGRSLGGTDEFGHGSQFTYNSLNQLLSTTDPTGATTDFAYDPFTHALTQVQAPSPDGQPNDRPTMRYRYDERAVGTTGGPGPFLQGLRGVYYTNADLAGLPAAVENDAAVDYNWGASGPPALSGASSYSVRWSGLLNVTSPGDYAFTTNSDIGSGTRLIVADARVPGSTVSAGTALAIDNWSNPEPVATSRALHLDTGLHRISLAYKEPGGASEIELDWACNSCSPAISQQMIPPESLRPGWLNPTTTVDPIGRITFQHYADPATGQPDYALVPADGQNAISTFAYADPFGRLTQQVMPKGNAGRTMDSQGNLQGNPDFTYATSWSYYAPGTTASTPTVCGSQQTVDQQGLVQTVSGHGLHDITYVYNANGAAVSITNGAGATTYCYDYEQRLVNEQAPGDSQPTTFGYDPAGLLRAASNAVGTITYDYDEGGRLVHAIDSYGAESRYTYDPDGNLLTNTSAAGSLASKPNFTTNYTYDVADRLTGLTDPAGRQFAFFYDNRNALHAVRYPNNTFAWYDRNPDGWITAVYNRHGGLFTIPDSVPPDQQSSPIIDFSYSYNDDGTIASETRAPGGQSTTTQSYAYDAAGRLAQVILPDGTVRVYSYDLDSNRTQIAETPSGGSQTVTASYSYDDTQTPGVDQLTSVTQGTTTTNYSYDSDGSTVSRGADTLAWDGWGRLLGGSFAGTGVSYNYDPIGRRSSRTSGTSVRRYLFTNSQAAPIFELNGSGTITNTYIEGAGYDLLQYRGSPTSGTATEFDYYDAHGNQAAWANENGVRKDTTKYDPFGAITNGTPSSPTTRRWLGRFDKQLDTTTKLIEMGARPYDPAVGRFLSVDPVGSSVNNYDYAGQDPINGYDLDGLMPLSGDEGPCGCPVVVSKPGGGTQTLQPGPPPPVHSTPAPPAYDPIPVSAPIGSPASVAGPPLPVPNPTTLNSEWGKKIGTVITCLVICWGGFHGDGAHTSEEPVTRAPIDRPEDKPAPKRPPKGGKGGKKKFVILA